MAFDISGKVVLVSGGAGDIGSSIVKSLVKENCRTIIGDVDESAAKKLKDELGSSNVSTVAIDITDEKSIANAMEHIGKEYGHIDALINVAGILCRKSVFDTEKADFERSLAINVIGAFLLTKGAIPLMKNSTSGAAVVNISSLNGSAAVENRIVYGATKAALDMMTRSFALELGGLGITVNSVAPGVVDSKMCRVRLDTEEKIQAFCRYIPQGRLSTPEDVAGAVMFLISPYSRGITGDIMLVDGGIIARQALPR